MSNFKPLLGAEGIELGVEDGSFVVHVNGVEKARIDNTGTGSGTFSGGGSGTGFTGNGDGTYNPPGPIKINYPASAPLTSLYQRTNAPTNVDQNVWAFTSIKGTATIADRTNAVYAVLADGAGVVSKTITGAANNGSGLIRITATGHTLSTGDKVAVYGVTGTTEANGAWTITVIDANTFDLQGSTFTNAYVSGGHVTNRPGGFAVAATVVPSVDRGGLTGTATSGDDIACFSGFNGGTAKGTDAYYLGRNSGIAGSEWTTTFTSDANADFGINLNGVYVNTGLGLRGTFGTYGIDFNLGTFTGGAMRLKNEAPVFGRNGANSADLQLFRIASNNALIIGDSGALAQIALSSPTAFAWSATFNDGVNVSFGFTNGTKIGTGSSEKFAFWGATPAAQQVLATGASHTVDNVITFLQSIGLCRQA